MIEDDARRLSMVRELLEFKKPLVDILKALSQFPWDYDRVGVEISRNHLANVLTLYLRDQLSAEQVEDWANSIEGRDDVDFGNDPESIKKDILYELANPLLTQQLDHDRAIQLLGILEA